MPRGPRPIVFALAAAALALAWQALTVRYCYGGNWTGLFCVGALFKPPPAALAGENLYKFPNSYGYDGQLYHYMAHDPFLLRGFQSSLDSPRFRYRRMLMPAAAWLLAAGQDRFVDAAYVVVGLLAVFLGAWWVALLAREYGRNPAWGLAFLLLPAVTVSLDRMTVDGALAAVVAGVAYFLRRGRWGAVVLLCAAAGLVRESGCLLAAGIVVWLLSRREFRRAGLVACSLLPTAAWYLYISSRTVAEPVDLLSPIPFVGLVQRVLTPYTYTFTPAINAVATALDYVALAGVVAAIVYCVRNRGWLIGTAEGWMALAFVLLLAMVSTPQVWIDAYAFARGFSPLFLLVALDGLRTGSAWAVLPLAMIAPRIVLQLGPQAVHIVGGLAGR
jgi:hypothetical protein